jgi:glycosyltransferase involved in cell wall biosynthesis
MRTAGEPQRLTVALLPAGDRFEDFHDKIGVSLETYCTQLAGGWLFNYIKALRLAGVRTVLIYVSARVKEPMRVVHADSGAGVWVLPSPRVHVRSRHLQRRFAPDSRALAAVASYLATPLRGISRVLRREGCGAILCQEYENTRFDWCVLLGRLLHLPVFANFQGGSDSGTVIERVIRRYSVPNCAGLVVGSQHEISRVQRRYRLPMTRIGAIPNAVEVVDDRGNRNAVRAGLGIGTPTRVVAWHGRVQVQTKGLDVLLDAWDLICRERSAADIRLLLVGNGRDAERLRNRIASSRKVTWIDRYVFDRRELWSYLHAADVYTIPSRREGFAVAILEAMACGLPVVATDAPGVVDVIPRGEADGGLIVPRESAGALARALMRVMDDRDLAERLGRLASQRVQTEFSLAVVGAKLRNFLFPSPS